MANKLFKKLGLSNNIRYTGLTSDEYSDYINSSESEWPFLIEESDLGKDKPPFLVQVYNRNSHKNEIFEVLEDPFGSYAPKKDLDCDIHEVLEFLNKGIILGGIFYDDKNRGKDIKKIFQINEVINSFEKSLEFVIKPFKREPDADVENKVPIPTVDFGLYENAYNSLLRKIKDSLSVINILKNGEAGEIVFDSPWLDSSESLAPDEAKLIELKEKLSSAFNPIKSRNDKWVIKTNEVEGKYLQQFAEATKKLEGIIDLNTTMTDVYSKIKDKLTNFNIDNIYNFDELWSDAETSLIGELSKYEHGNRKVSGNIVSLLGKSKEEIGSLTKDLTGLIVLSDKEKKDLDSFSSSVDFLGGKHKVLTAFDIIFNKINPYFPTADTKLVSNKNLIESYHNSLSPFGKLFLDFRNMLDEKQEVYKTATFSDKLTCNIPDNQNLTQAVSDLLSLNKSVLYFKQILEKKQKVYDKLGEGVFLESAIRLPDDYRAGVKSTIGRFKGLYDNISSVYNKTFDDLFSQNTELDKSILILRNQKKL